MTLGDAIKSIYARHSAGCCCHLVLDDLNTDDASLLYCYGAAKEEAHDDCKRALERIVVLPENKRAKLIERWKEAVLP